MSNNSRFLRLTAQTRRLAEAAADAIADGLAWHSYRPGTVDMAAAIAACALLRANTSEMLARATRASKVG